MGDLWAWNLHLWAFLLIFSLEFSDNVPDDISARSLEFSDIVPDDKHSNVGKSDDLTF